MRLAINFLLRRDHDVTCLHVAYAFFCAFSLFLTLYHTPWRDEAQAWLLARDLSVWQLFLEARHDGHPILWHLCLKVVQAAGFNYWGMMLLNWAFMAFAIWLLFYRSTIPLSARIVVALCPACLLHVSYNARNYAISAMLIFIAAILYRNVSRRPIGFSVVLALLASTNVYAAAVFVGISFQFLLEQAFSSGQNRFSLRPLFTRYLPANLILLAGALLLVAQLAPVPLPGEPTVGRPVLTFSFNPSCFAVVLLLIPLFLTCIPKSPGCPRIFGGILTVGLVLIPACLYGMGTRHAFMVVVETVYFIWIYLDDILRNSSAKTPPRESFMTGLAALLIITICIACQWAGLRTAFKYEFDSRRTAQAIIAHHLDQPDTLLVTTDPAFSTPLLLFFKNIRVTYGPPPYGPPPQSFADFFLTRMRTHIPTLEEMKPLVMNLAREHPDKTLMVVSVNPGNPPPRNDDPSYQLVPVYLSPPPPVDDHKGEFYQVYLLKK